jgi:FKBP-type peptidyl-prolyl cis-trans isomerase FklB
LTSAHCTNADLGQAGAGVLPDGLQSKILTEGKGKTPTDTDSVLVNSRGTRLDGKVFDSSCKRGQLATLALTGVIPGWREALKLMPGGSK